MLSWLPGFDPILFHAATLPTFAAAVALLGIALFVADRPAPQPLVGIAAALLAVAIVAYPSWLTETPPAAFALPLVFSLWRVWRDELDTRWLVLLSAVVALDYFQTKVIAIMALGLLLARRARRAAPAPAGLSAGRRDRRRRCSRSARRR